ncbi:hypothetical protein CLU79DRAFT_838473 [Phycomyces nitens]|nr:hypothetical protein CLU79DRAFT_838473 [Phycomyces nitens]
MDRASHSSSAVSSAHKTSYSNLHRRSLKALKTSLPLTKENLMLVTDETEQPVNMLVRYYTGMATASSETSSISSVPIRRRERRPSSMDAVMQSPRLLPFPYHNDSLFLPTAEQGHRPSTLSSPNSSLVDISISNYQPPNGSTPAPSRRSSATDYRRPAQVPQAPRRQSSAPGSFNKARIAFTKKHRTSKRKSAPATVQNLPSLDTSSNSSDSSDPCEPESPNWISRALKFFSKRKTAPPPSVGPAKVCRFSEQPVWYSQYANNPRPTPIILASQSMAAAA